MNLKRIAFRRAEDVTKRGDDSRSFLFRFFVVTADLIGLPEEGPMTTEHRLVINIANNRLPAWRLHSETDLIKVLFEIGSREVIERVRVGILEREVNVSVNALTHSRTCPFDPARIQDPQSMEIEFKVEEERTIGFKGRP